MAFITNCDVCGTSLPNMNICNRCREVIDSVSADIRIDIYKRRDLQKVVREIRQKEIQDENLKEKIWKMILQKGE